MGRRPIANQAKNSEGPADVRLVLGNVEVESILYQLTEYELLSQPKPHGNE